MRIVCFLNGQLTRSQRAAMARRKALENAATTTNIFNLVEETLKAHEARAEQTEQELKQLRELYKFKVVASECWKSTPSICQCLDADELATYRDFTR